MTTYIDLLMDEDDGDLSIVDGDFALTATSGQSLRQRLEARFSTWKGEWAYNTAFGTPYKQQLLIGGVTQEQADAIFTAQIYLEDDVTSIKNIVSTLDKTTRSYKLSRIEAYVDNEELDLTLATPSLTAFSYPEPRVLEDDFDVCGYSTNLISNSDLLYEIINFDLPVSGQSTWWFDDTSEYTPQINEIHATTNYLMAEGGSQTWWNTWGV